VASSVADCLQEEPKNYTILDQGRANLILVPDQPAYAEVDWRDTATQAKFVRVTGKATAEEAADAVGKVARLRQSSDAFVVTNAIDIKGDAINEEFAKSLENVKSFNVLEALKKLLSEDEIAIIESLK